MSQIETGIRKVLSNGTVYDFLQMLMGAKRNRLEFVRDFIKPEANNSFLDIGCGTADILKYLPKDINYFGFDQSETYIDQARSNFGDRGVFECALVDSLITQKLPSMDIVLAGGLLHHLDDEQVKTLLITAKQALKPNGKFIAVDPCYSDQQNIIAKWLVSKDRGNNVRDQSGYQHLVGGVFEQVESHVIERTWIPYTHHIMVCRK